MKHRNLSLVSLLLVAILLFTACGNDQTPATSPEASTPAASASPEAAEPTDEAGNTLPSVTPAVLTPPVDATPTPDADGTPDVTPDAPLPTGTGTAAPTEGGTLQPASPAVSEAEKATPAPSENKTPTKGGSKPTSTPKPSNGKKLLYAISDVGVQDAPNYYTSGSLGKLTHGKQYEVLETIKGTTMTWYRISFNGKNGYVETKYLAAQYCSPTPTHAYTQKELAQMVGTGVVYTEVCPEMLTLVNEVRGELGLRLDMWGDKELEEIALARVVDTIQELEDGCVHSGAKNYWHEGLDSNIGEIFAWGAQSCKTAFEVWRDSPGHWASIVSDCTEDEIAECDYISWDGRKVKAGDVVPGEDSYMVCAHAIFEGEDYWVIVYAGKQRPWPND